MKALITGAAGNLGAKLAGHWAGRHELTLLERAGSPSIQPADLSQWDESWVAAFRGVDLAVHLAGDPVAYHDWDDLTGPNVDAVANVFEAAARSSVRRVVFASSNHVMGGYRDVPGGAITEALSPKPGLRYTVEGKERFSGAYAATKLFGERLGRHYADARGLEVLALRIGWVWRGNNVPEGLPADRGEWFRQMWLSDRDYLHLMDCCAEAVLPGRFLIVNGMSDNAGMRWDLTTARQVLGYRPRDSVSKKHRE